MPPPPPAASFAICYALPELQLVSLKRVILPEPWPVWGRPAMAQFPVPVISKQRSDGDCITVANTQHSAIERSTERELGNSLVLLLWYARVAVRFSKIIQFEFLNSNMWLLCKLHRGLHTCRRSWPYLLVLENLISDSVPMTFNRSRSHIQPLQMKHIKRRFCLFHSKISLVTDKLYYFTMSTTLIFRILYFFQQF